MIEINVSDKVRLKLTELGKKPEYPTVKINGVEAKVVSLDSLASASDPLNDAVRLICEPIMTAEVSMHGVALPVTRPPLATILVSAKDIWSARKKIAKIEGALQDRVE